MAKQGINLKAEMAKKLKEIEEQWRKDKEEANQKFQQDRKKYEDQIESLQKQVMEQSMTMSMYRSVKNSLRIGCCRHLVCAIPFFNKSDKFNISN